MIIERALDFTNKDLQKIFADSESADVVGIDQFFDSFMERCRVEPKDRGYVLPWGDTHDLVRLRTGEISVWAGINGHKKSTVLSQVALHATLECPVGIASFEMKLEDTAAMMCKQAAGVDNVTQEFAKDFAAYANEKIYWYRALGGVQPLEALGAIAAMADKGCKITVLDNLQFCGVTDDIERERLFVNQLIGLAEAKDIHIAVVHHVRKPSQGGDEYVPTRFDVRGGGTIVDQAHLLMICWHNKRRAQVVKAQEMGIPVTPKDLEELNKAGFKLVVTKQRNAPFEGTINLWDANGRTFKRQSGGQSIRLKIPRTGGYGV